MRENSVKRKLQRGESSIGTMVFEFNSTGIGRIAREAGAEFVIYDMEHTGWHTETVRMLMATSSSCGLVPLVRVPATEYHFLARVLDIGAMGLMVPMVQTAEQAEFIVRSTKYPPTGQRGAAFSMAHDDYSGGDIIAKMQSANDELLIITQIETAQGLENVEKIAAVEGVDLLWIGQFDLTNSLGIPGQFDHPLFEDAVKRVAAAAKEHGKTAGIMALNIEEARRMHQSGFRCLAYGGDLWLYQQALQQGIAEVRGIVAE